MFSIAKPVDVLPEMVPVLFASGKLRAVPRTSFEDVKEEATGRLILTDIVSEGGTFRATAPSTVIMLPTRTQKDCLTVMPAAFKTFVTVGVYTFEDRPPVGMVVTHDVFPDASDCKVLPAPWVPSAIFTVPLNVAPEKVGALPVPID